MKTKRIYRNRTTIYGYMMKLNDETIKSGKKKMRNKRVFHLAIFLMTMHSTILSSKNKIISNSWHIELFTNDILVCSDKHIRMTTHLFMSQQFKMSRNCFHNEYFFFVHHFFSFSPQQCSICMNEYLMCLLWWWCDVLVHI